MRSLVRTQDGPTNRTSGTVRITVPFAFSGSPSVTSHLPAAAILSVATACCSIPTASTASTDSDWRDQCLLLRQKSATSVMSLLPLHDFRVAHSDDDHDPSWFPCDGTNDLSGTALGNTRLENGEVPRHLNFTGRYPRGLDNGAPGSPIDASIPLLDHTHNLPDHSHGTTIATRGGGLTGGDNTPFLATRGDANPPNFGSSGVINGPGMTITTNGANQNEKSPKFIPHLLLRQGPISKMRAGPFQ